MAEDKTRDIWNRLAPWWDNALGEGNEFQDKLIIPATDRLLGPVEGKAVLDIACGNGNYSRRLSQRGADVVAFDFAQTFIERAKAKGHSSGKPIQYLVLDATDEAQICSLGTRRFDAAVCSMALMDMPTIKLLLKSLTTIMRPGAPFVFSLPHPCFNSNYSKMFCELVNEGGKLRQEYGVKVTQYITETADLSAGILNQPEPHFMFHRPLSTVLQSCFEAGFVLDGLEEPTYPEGTSAKNPFSWGKRPQIPPAIVIRVRSGS